MKVEYVICTFSLCTDVLDGVLQFGTRRKLSKLECIGRRFHFVIANRFVERPLLVLRRIRTVFNEKLWKSDKEAFESESGFDKFKAILEAPGVEGYHSEEVFKISNLMIDIDFEKRNQVLILYITPQCDHKCDRYR